MRHLLFAAFSIFLAPTAWAEASCPPPKIVYETRAPAPSMDRSLGVGALSGISDGKAPSQGSYDHVLGHYLSGRSLSVQVSGVLVSNGGVPSHVCVSEARVEHFMAPVIRLAADIPAGSCTEGEVWRHGLQHFAIARDALSSMRSAVEANVSKVSWRSDQLRSPADADAFLSNYQRWLMKRVNSDFERMTVPHQLSLDSGAEYDRVDRACSGEPRRIANAAEQAAPSSSSPRHPSQPARSASPRALSSPAASAPAASKSYYAPAVSAVPAKPIYGGSNPWVPR